MRESPKKEKSVTTSGSGSTANSLKTSPKNLIDAAMLRNCIKEAQ